MGNAKYAVETEFIRTLAASYQNEIGWTPMAQGMWEALGCSLLHVLQVLRTGDVVYSEKEDPDGATFVVEGETVDDLGLRIGLVVYVDRYHARIEKVEEAQAI